MTDDGRQRRLAAKRNNERVKLGASFLNTLGLAVIGAAFIVPGVASIANVRWIWIPVGVGLHLAAQALLYFLKPED